MSEVRTSGCFCGAVQLELTGEPNVQCYCHCGSCRGWLGAPIHGATLWPTPSVTVVKGADKLVTFKKTEASHRQFCNNCGSPVLIRHPAIAMTDVPSGTIPSFAESSQRRSAFCGSRAYDLTPSGASGASFTFAT